MRVYQCRERIQEEMQPEEQIEVQAEEEVLEEGANAGRRGRGADTERARNHIRVNQRIHHLAVAEYTEKTSERVNKYLEAVDRAPTDPGVREAVFLCWLI
ncbi:unnamed protein product [Strongylus vulgaris]|uniref:Uncharacterized protein n=1 Tax=Strongylus vulgaris TaxID=40348 RepID=A0A3P7LPM5_STRVU|nr:unnamed protein product [Strongylus vulgaris]